MSLSNLLEQGGHPPTSLDVSAEVTLGQGAEGLAITTVVLTVRGTAPGVDAAEFDRAAQGAKQSCPVSKALSGGPTITLDAALDG